MNESNETLKFRNVKIKKLDPMMKKKNLDLIMEKKNLDP